MLAATNSTPLEIEDIGVFEYLAPCQVHGNPDYRAYYAFLTPVWSLEMHKEQQEIQWRQTDFFYLHERKKPWTPHTRFTGVLYWKKRTPYKRIP
ncbi:hypothetical protein ACP4OV_015559 [Aristida adscensionis]